MHSILFLVDVMHHGPMRPNAVSGKRAEQRRFDWERVEARHGFRRIRAFDVELIGLREHDGRNARSGF